LQHVGFLGDPLHLLVDAASVPIGTGTGNGDDNGNGGNSGHGVPPEREISSTL
jgi:hypothetical protein